MRRTISPFLIPLLPWLIAGCQGPFVWREASVRPGINDHYKNPDVETWVGRFESDEREIYHHRHKIIEIVGCRPGTIIADIGAGTGFMAELFSDEVGPDGEVLAVDITEAFLERIRTRAMEQGRSNIQTVLCTERSVELPRASIDLAFVCDTYHHFEYPRSTLSSIHSALKPGGQLILIDFDRHPRASRQWVLEHVRAGRDAIKDEIRRAGFQLIEDVPVPFLAENYLLRFGKVTR